MSCDLFPLIEIYPPYYGKESLTVKGNPALSYNVNNSFTIEWNPLRTIEGTPYYRRKPSTIEGNAFRIQSHSFIGFPFVRYFPCIQIVDICCFEHGALACTGVVLPCLTAGTMFL